MNRPTCYHCGEKPARAGSVFCQKCAPQPTAQECAEAMHGHALPSIIHEDNRTPRPPEGFRAWLARLFAPYRHAANLAARFEALYRELQDTAQSNLALRRKCADLKAQRDALRDQLDSEEIGIKGLRGQLAQARAEIEELEDRIPHRTHAVAADFQRPDEHEQ